jgi:uncharacterized protein YbaP (TraB family)
MLTAIILGNVMTSFSQQTYLWKVTSKNNDKVSYLFGTYHKTSESFFHKYPALEEALDHTETVVTEVEIKKKDLLAPIHLRTPTNDLQNTVDAKDYALITEILHKSDFDLRKLYPDEIIGLLQNKFDELNCDLFFPGDKYFLDEYVQVLSESKNKETVYLETVDQQKDYISQTNQTISWKSSKTYISLILKQYRKYQKSGKNTCPMVTETYLDFKYKYQLDKDCSKLSNNKKLMLQQRNQQWMQVLPGLIESKNTFIAIGLGHLFYNCGIIQQLSALGYNVEPVAMQ